MQRTLLLLLVLVAILGCRREVDVSKPSAVDAVARVDGEPIGTAEFVVAFTAAHALPDTPETRRELLDDLVLRRAGTRRAIQLGLDKDPEVRRALENVLVGALRKREFDSDRSEISV
ncbi:MAG: hypothetical protein JNL97_12435, partial [Verrucomicrobiales bacterium]|nr:hypothetical protein [Verrucomicrobiales bacterium]